MTVHKFRVGELVDFNPSQEGISASRLKYKILRLLPCEQGKIYYQIKTIGEPLVRIALEGELTSEPIAYDHGRVLQFGERGTGRGALAATD